MLGKHTMTTRRRQGVTMERKGRQEEGRRKRGGRQRQQGKKAQLPKMLDLESQVDERRRRTAAGKHTRDKHTFS